MLMGCFLMRQECWKAARQPRELLSPRLGRTDQSRGRWPGAFGRATCQPQRSTASGDVRDPPPCSQRYSTISIEFAEKTSRLMSPFSKDETGHES